MRSIKAESDAFLVAVKAPRGFETFLTTLFLSLDIVDQS